MELDDLVTDWLTLPDLADRIGQPITKVRQLVRDGHLPAVRRGDPAVLMVPAALECDGQLVKGLSSLATLLSDAGYSTEEALRWMFTSDGSLPGRPVDALRENRGTEVKRRAQALAF